MQDGKTALDRADTEEIKNLLRNAPSVADRQKHAAAAATKIDADAAAKKIDDAAAAQKIADDAVKVQFPLTPIYFLAHVINSTITYLFIIKFSGFWLVYQLLYVFRCFVPSCVTSIHILIPVLI